MWTYRKTYNIGYWIDAQDATIKLNESSETQNFVILNFVILKNFEICCVEMFRQVQ